MRQRTARVDANQKSVVAALRKLGAEVTHLHTLGNGVADILVSWRQRWYVMEVKDGSKPPSRRTLTADEYAWIERQRATVYVVETPEQALEVLTR